MDLAGVAAILTAATALLALVGAGLRWVYAQATRHCDGCCTERDALRAGNDEALAAYRRLEREELAAWRARPGRGHGGEGGG